MSKHCRSALLRAKTFSLALLLASGCAGNVPRDSAPLEAFDASTVPDAVPKVEPLSRFGNPESYVVFGERYAVLDSAHDYRARGVASWYGTKFHGRRTSSGEPYDMYKMTAAHKTLPLPSYVRVTNLDNGKSAIVRVNDRGPFHDGRIIDLSYAAALKLDVVATGTARVEVVALDPATFAAAPAAPVPEIAPATAEPAAALFIQLGAFAEAGNALDLKGRLETAGIRPVRIDTEPDPALFRVRVGPFAAADAANDIALKLIALGIGDFRIVSE